LLKICYTIISTTVFAKREQDESFSNVLRDLNTEIIRTRIEVNEKITDELLARH